MLGLCTVERLKLARNSKSVSKLRKAQMLSRGRSSCS